VALAPSRSDATAGSALDGDLDRQDNARRRWTSQPHSRGVSNCGARGRVTAGHHRPGGSGDSRPASAARPRQRPRAREGAPLPTPGRGQAPAHSPLRLWPWWSPPPRLAPTPGVSRVLLTLPARAEALRWRAEGAPLNP